MTQAEKIQNEIYRKMSADKKLKIVDDFYRFSKKLQKTNQKNNDHPKIHQPNKQRLRPA